MLVEKFNKALADASSTAQDSYLVQLSRAVKAVNDKLHAEPELQVFASKLSDLLDQPNFGVSPHLTNKFAQTLGEAHFWILSLGKGVPLTRIPEERNRKTPDFKYIKGDKPYFFEVKTLSVVGGDDGIAEALDSSLDAQIDLESQRKAGASVAMATSEAMPYGDKVGHDKPVSGTINTLLEKIRGNIKADQFANPNTFLVVNLSIIPPFTTEPKALRPAYPDDYQFPKAITGELWSVAFGQRGMPILGNPEFEGKPCVEEIFDKCGILMEEEYADVAGLLFMVHPWQRPSEIWGLFRSADVSAYQDSQSTLLEVAMDLTGELWNDCTDTNGWRLK
ncbi:hypothetical protein JQN63_14430 [Delftia lacustris]|uniref:hypothetical protein n=1 Tax=Delftia lacustris TaxID=558537 RepID=UPI00193AE7A3|nr:hypothetical protein [Delftia lacustris]QRI92998.1 hypothetical protein JQN63_14430 [Delftia lacustris]